MKFSIFSVLLILLLTVFSNKILAQHSEHETLLFSSVEKLPHYPGGWDLLFSELNKEFKRNNPTIQVQAEEQPVFISFVVNKTGIAEEFKIEKSGNETWDNEVLEVFKKLNSWVPGENDGQKVEVKMVLPFRPN